MEHAVCAIPNVSYTRRRSLRGARCDPKPLVHRSAVRAQFCADAPEKIPFSLETASDTRITLCSIRCSHAGQAALHVTKVHKSLSHCTAYIYFSLSFLSFLALPGHRLSVAAFALSFSPHPSPLRHASHLPASMPRPPPSVDPQHRSIESRP